MCRPSVADSSSLPSKSLQACIYSMHASVLYTHSMLCCGRLHVWNMHVPRILTQALVVPSTGYQANATCKRQALTTGAARSASSPQWQGFTRHVNRLRWYCLQRAGRVKTGRRLDLAREGPHQAPVLRPGGPLRPRAARRRGRASAGHPGRSAVRHCDARKEGALACPRCCCKASAAVRHMCMTQRRVLQANERFEHYSVLTYMCFCMLSLT